MTTPNKTRANQRNALKSTGPMTVAGRERAAKNASKHGLYTAAVVPGESAEEFARLCAAVRRELRAESVLERRLADRVALIFWRLDRVARYEAGVAAAAGVQAPPDPDTITGDGVDLCLPLHPAAPPESHLAYARAQLDAWVPIREACRIAAAALAGEGGTDPLPRRGEYVVSREVGQALGWQPGEASRNWAAATADWPADCPLAGEGLLLFVRTVAEAAGKNPDEVVPAVRDRLATLAEEHAAAITEKESEVEPLAAKMRVAREAALAAAAYGDGAAAERVMRLEAHLTRQLGLALVLLERLRGEESAGVGRGIGAIFREIAGASQPLPLPEAVASFRNGVITAPGLDGVPEPVFGNGTK
jgi:hypothetical protein